MKTLYLFVSGLLISSAISAQPCATSAAAGSSSNAFTNIRNATNAIAADKDLNTVVFIHRNNAAAFGGSSGNFRYDVSTDGGSTWTNNQGVLNPLLTLPGRYPQVAIYNPSGNTTATNAYISYLGPTVSGSAFSGYVSGVRQLNGTGNTETYNQPASTQTLIPNSMVKGAPGTMWAIDAVNNGTATTGFRVFKGVWNGSNDFVWSTQATLTPPFNTAFNGNAQIGDYHIAFDPTGQFGWVSILTHITPGPTSYAFYPVFYRTTDGGNTWSGPIQVDLGQFPCITGNIVPGNVPSTAFESDLTVDVNGEPHLLTTLCNGNNAYAVFFSQWHSMFDITFTDGLWNAVEINVVQSGRGTWGVAPNTTTMDNQPMIARSADGTKIFYAWSDNISYATGQANLTPNIFSRAFDVTSRMWTNVRDFTGCNPSLNGLMFHPKLAAEVLEPAAGQYKLAALYTIFTANDPINVANFAFLNNIVWSTSDFITPQPTANVSINEGASWLLCPNDTIGISITGTFNQILWSNNGNTLTTNISTPGTYYVTARAGCTIGHDSIVVTGATALIGVSDSVLCVGDSVLLTATGNAYNFTWTPGNVVNDSLLLTPSSNTTVSLTAGGDGGCTFTSTQNITVNALPFVAAAAVPTGICLGDSTNLLVTGAATYVWSPGNTTSSSFFDTPAATTNYTVTGTDINGCTNADTITVTVNPIPVVVAVSDTSVVCSGDTVSLIASGAANYQWTGGAHFPLNDTTTANPLVNTTYIVTGTDSNGCSSNDTINIAVNTLPVVQATQNGPLCEGDTLVLTASGANSYVWQPSGSIGSVITEIPAAGQFTYTVTGTDGNGCSNDAVISAIVNPAPLVVATGQSPICSGSSTVLVVTGTAGSYVWNPGNLTGSTVVVNPSSTTSYVATGTDLNGCTSSDTFQVVVNPLPNVGFTLSTTSVCFNDGPLILTGGTPAGGTYGGTGVSAGAFNPSAAGIGVYTIYYAYTDASGCSDTVNQLITVNPCTGIGETEHELTTIYPNPFTSELTLQYGGQKPAAVIVTNALGQIIYTTTISNSMMHISTYDWPAGMYHVQISTSDHLETHRLMKD